MEHTTRFPWRPGIVRRSLRTPLVEAYFAYGPGNEPARQCAESCAVCSVACLAWVCGDGRTTCWHCGHFAIVYRFRKPYLQKRLRSGSALQWKSPRLSARGRWGITVRTKWQSGMQESATPVRSGQRETACTATAGPERGKPTRPKP